MTMSTLLSRWVRTLVVCIAAALILVACGSDDSGELADSENPAGQQIVPTVTAPPDESRAAEDSEEGVTTDQDAAQPTVPAPGEPSATEVAPSDEGEPAPEQQESEPADPAPPLGSIDAWHNSDPLTLDELRGRPVLLVFWADF